MAANVPKVTISNGSQTMPLPVIGLGTATHPQVPETTKSAILDAIETGYRHFDTAFIYGSEKPLGEAIAEAIKTGLIKSRDELFITSKLWCTFASPELVLPAIKTSLRNLQLEYLDLFLVHWPLKISGDVKRLPIPKETIFPIDIKAVWEVMEECQNLGLTKAIGVSNFSTRRIDELLSFAKIPPSVNQVEMNPLWQQKDLRGFCKAKGIHITAYSPLGSRGAKWGDSESLEYKVLEEIAKAKGKTAAQVSLRWVYEQGVSFVPKSFNKDRMKQNLDIFDWSLTEEELNKISKLPQRRAVLPSMIMEPSDLVREIEAEI
ncbi:D-galacturonate reductase [Quercus suber]|uniref:D-galacturonate reductase n=1 Tax=Quercus suber TaxID=58331 RepID=A0AAW0LD81_QUESU|nr:D-galacturonate reductase-like [Quercus suber]POE91372.1 d-galacturonate reductase [Quercus suber]